MTCCAATALVKGEDEAMSGPIVRKYGFPNFDQIFGKRDLEHGVDEPAKNEDKGQDSQANVEAKQAEKPGAPASTTKA